MQMDSKNTASVALFLSISLLFCALVSSNCDSNPSSNTPKPPPTPTKASPPVAPILVPSPPRTYSNGKCPENALRLGVCANVLNLVNVVAGSPPTLPCCSLIQGLVDIEAAVCLCTAIRANILGINLNVSIALSLVLNNCGKKVPSGFECS